MPPALVPPFVRGEQRAPARRREGLRFLLPGAVLGVALVAGVLALLGPSGSARHRVPPVGTAAPRGSAPGRHLERGEFPWRISAAAATLVLVAGAAGGLIATRHRRQRPGARSFRHARGAAARALSDEPLPEDPRAAVLEAYTRMEAALGYSGQPRAQGEPPRRYSRRVAVVRPEVAAAIGELTDLVETAAFSAHEVGPADRRRAASALAVVARREAQTAGRAVKPG